MCSLDNAVRNRLHGKKHIDIYKKIYDRLDGEPLRDAF